MEKKIIIVAGEPSGDLQAGLLIAKLKELDNSLTIYAVGGDCLRKAGARIIHDIKDLSVLGFFDAVKKLHSFKRLMEFLIHKVTELKPDAVIFVDFSGFNLRLAKKIHTLTKTIYYISPQVWASRQGRVKTIKECIDKMIVIFEFEREFYRRFGIEAEFVGHPLLDIVKPTLTPQEARQAFGLKENNPVFALLPGSRLSEIKNILPIMLQSARLIKEKLPNAQFIISKPLSLDTTLYEKIVNPLPRGERVKMRREDVKIIEGKQYDCLNVADFVLVSSGTATLETAILGKPNVVIYKMSALNYMLYRPLVKVPYIGMENIVAGKCIAPEFIQFRATPEAIAKKVLEILSDTERLDGLKKDFTALREKLGEPGAPVRAALNIIAFINS